MPYARTACVNCFRAGEINPDTLFGIVSAGNTSASTIKAAAAVVATDPNIGKKLPATSNPNAKSAAEANIASSAERKRQREALVVTFGSWDKIHVENIRYGGPADLFALGELGKAKRAFAE